MATTHDSSCPHCGSPGSEHSNEKECIFALRGEIDRLAMRLAAVEHAAYIAQEREWAFRLIRDYKTPVLNPEWRERLTRWIAQETDPEILEQVLSASNQAVREIAIEHAPREAWTTANLQRALPYGLPILAVRRLLPTEWACETELRDWIQPIGSKYRRAYFSGTKAGIALSGLAKGGYPIPEKLWKEAARLAGETFFSHELEERIEHATGVLDIPELSEGNLRNIARAFLSCDRQRVNDKIDSGLVYQAVLNHPACTEQIALRIANSENARPYSLRALAGNARWRRAPRIYRVLASQSDAQVLLPLCLDPDIARADFASMFRKAVTDQPEYVMSFIEEHDLPHLVPEDLVPLMQSPSQTVRLRAITYLSAMDNSTRERTIDSPSRSRKQG